MRLVLVGAPGSGKGTQAELLVKRLGLVYVGTGSILRDAIAHKTPTGLLVQPLMDQGLLVPDGIVNDVVAELLQKPDRPERFVLDGYPRTRAQAVAFDALQKKLELPLTAVVSFAISDDEVVQRINNRRKTTTAGGRHARDDDHEATVRRRLQEFHNTTDALLEYYRRNGLLREVDATQPVEAIYQSVLDTIARMSQ